MSSDTSSVSDREVLLPSALLHKQLAQNILRAPTPDTEVTEQKHHPDISILCEKCQSYVAVRLLQAHRAYHNALIRLEYRGNQRPDNVEGLTKRRQQILRRLTKSTGTPPTSAIQLVNDAYGLLKAYIEDTYESLMGVKVDSFECHGLALNCSAVCARAVGICSDANQRWKPTMEDTRVFQDFFGNDGNKCFFAIYDGYSGRFAADVAANDLHHFLLNEMAKFDPVSKCTCTINLAGYHDLTDYKLDRPKPIVRKDSLRHILHEESRNIIKQIMYTCEENMSQLNNQNGNVEESRSAPSIVKVTPSDTETERTDVFGQNIENALRQSYRMTDYVLSYGIDETSRVRWSGCSGVSCIIQNLGPEEEEEENEDQVSDEDGDGKKDNGGGGGDDESGSAASAGSKGRKQRGRLYLANAGNCHAVLCRNGKAQRLSRNHTLSNNSEKSRVKRSGASVQGDSKGYRINGVLDTTRGLGNHGDPRLKAAVAAEPYTTTVSLDAETEFLILASNGVWEVLSESEAVSILVQMLPGRDIPPPTAPGEDDYLRMIKGHSKEQMAELEKAVDDLGLKLSMETNLDIDIPGEQEQDEVPDTQVTPSPKESMSSKSSVSSNVKDTSEMQLNGGGADGPVEVPAEIIPSTDSDLNQNEVKVGSPLVEDSSENTLKEESSKEDSEIHSDAVKPSDEEILVTDSNVSVPYADSDAGSEKTDFESMISAILENDDGNEADVETLTELHSIYAHSRLSVSGAPTRPEMYRSLAQAMGERLVQSALLAGSRDNITVMIILLPGCKI